MENKQQDQRLSPQSPAATPASEYSKELKELVCLLQGEFKCITPAELLHP